MDIQDKRKEINSIIISGLAKAESMAYCPIVFMMGMLTSLIIQGFNFEIFDLLRVLIILICITISGCGFKDKYMYCQMIEYSHDDKFIIFMYDKLHNKQVK